MTSIMDPALQPGPPEASPWVRAIEEVSKDKSLHSLMEDFHRLTRIPLAIVDVAGRILARVGWQPVCLEFHRAHPETCANCVADDSRLSTGIPPGNVRLYRCRNGMCDATTPLVVGGEHVANIFAGQFLFSDEPIDYGFFRAQARRCGFDEGRYIAALEQAPRLSREAVKTGMSFLTKLAGLVAALSSRNVALASALGERDRLMRSLRESEDMLKRAEAIAHVGSWNLDLLGGQLSWSDEVYRIFGLTPQEFGATYEAFLSFVHPEDRQAVDHSYSSSIREGKTSYEITHRIVRRGSREVRWVREKCQHIRDASGRIERSFGMVQDITEQRQAEEEKRHKQKLESVGVLAAGVAHDFNNLLAVILGNASLAQDTLGDSHPVSRFLEEVVRGGQHAADLTRQLLAYAGKGRFAIEPIDLSDQAHEMADLLRRTISRKISLNFDLQRPLPPIEADRGQIQQVLMNLLINAAEAIGAETGLIRIQTSASHCDDGHSAPGEYVRLEVTDNGPGMDEAVRGRIFEPFFTTKFTGRGLGLAAVDGVVRSHKGVIRVASEPGKGSRFTILFPAMPAACPGEHPRAGLAGPHGTESVLVVDDEEHVLKIACKGLAKYGYSILSAGSAAEALDICRGPERIDVVLLDSNMPVMSGEEAAPQLLALRPNLKIVITSGFSESQVLNGHPGLAGFIQKPYLPSQLAQKLRSILDL